MMPEPIVSKNLQAFIEQLHKRLAAVEIDRLSSAELEEMKQFIFEYRFEETDWKEFVFFNDRTYTRNLLDAGNGNFDLLLLGWGPNQFSSVHDHAGSHCIMRVLEGELEEIQFEPPSSLNMKSHNSLCAGQGTYIHDSIGWHQVGNKSKEKLTVSLHLYSPPIASCNVVCPRSGAIQRAKSSEVYSYLGKKL